MSDDQQKGVPEAAEPGASVNPRYRTSEVDLPEDTSERLDEDFDVATAREQTHEQHHHTTDDPSEAPEVVDGS